MIIPSKKLKQYIVAQKDKTKFAKKIGVSRQYVYMIKNGQAVNSFLLVNKILDATGFDFEDAFEVKE